MGATAYSPTSLQIAGITQSIKWSGNATPSATASLVNIYGFSFIRSGGAWAQVLGQQNYF